MQRLIIHAGLHKTGTSAIQAFLNDNRAWLRGFNYYYPDTVPFDAHHTFAASLKGRALDSVGIAHVAKVLLHYRNNASGQDVVISSEMLSEGVNPGLLACAADIFGEVNIVFYVRTQDNLIESAYNQQVKQNGESRKIDEYTPYMLNIYAHIKRFADELPFAKFFACEYRKDVFINGDLLDDFLSRVLGITNSEGVQVKRKLVNESLSPVACETLRRLNMHFKGSERQTMLEYIVNNFPQKKYRNYTLISPDLRSEIITKSTRSNDFLRQEFLRSGNMEFQAFNHKQYLSDDLFHDEVSAYPAIRKMLDLGDNQLALLTYAKEALGI